jgi:hypothetical protein
MRNEASARFRSWRDAAVPLLVLAAILLLGRTPAAHSADLYRVQGVPVDATAESAVAAREMAIAAGEREGLVRLMRRLTSPEDAGSLPDVSRLAVDRYVNSYEIAQEKLGPARYLGTLNISYVAAEVQALLRSANVPFVTRRSDPILVVPVEQTAEGPTAWLEAGAWRAAWDENLGQATVSVLALPLGDLADVAAAPPAALVAGDKAATDALAARYSTRTAVVAMARLERVADTGKLERIELDARRADAWNQPLLQTVVEVLPAEEEDAALSGAVGRVIAAIEDDWKRQTLVRAEPVSTVTVAVPLVDLAGWVQIRRELTGLPEVRSVQVESFGQTDARVTLAFVGEFEQLAAAVERVGLSLAQENDGWHLRPAGGPAAFQAPLSVLPATR